MGFVETWRDVRLLVGDVVVNMRVTPPVPPGRRPRAGASHEPAPKGLRDDTSSWSLYISYEDVHGDVSERRITCKRVERGLGGTLVVGAFCHERQAMRSFRVDRMREVVDLSTGEVVDPFGHFEMLAATGLPIVDRGIATFSKMLVFMTLCDGEGHPKEWEAIERGLVSYVMRFGGDDETIRQSMKVCHGLAPDGRDLTNCLGTLLRTPVYIRRQIARLTIESCANVIDADGRHAEEEIYWGGAIGAALKKLA